MNKEQRQEPRKRDSHSDQYGMSLPVGKTCGDCVHFSKCQWFVGQIAADETCDWSPSRFIEAARLSEVTEVRAV